MLRIRAFFDIIEIYIHGAFLGFTLSGLFANIFIYQNGVINLLSLILSLLIFIVIRRIIQLLQLEIKKYKSQQQHSF